MRTASAMLIATWVLCPTAISASGPLGIYAIVEKVVFEPNDAAPARIQVWGAFAYADGAGTESTVISKAARGYMYFRLPDSPPTGAAAEKRIETIRNEWADLKTVAGTGQAVGFGRWGYIASFSDLQPDQHPIAPSFTFHARPGGGGGDASDLRVRPAGEMPASPAVYQTNVGVVKLPDSGRFAPVVKQLRDALGR